jgi:NTE family protein
MSQFQNLAFEGGGVKGLAYGAAVEELEARGIMADIIRVAGTSAGAIAATLLALGATGEELVSVVAGTSFQSFMDDDVGVFRDGLRLVDHYGWFKGDSFVTWLERQVAALGWYPAVTFAELSRRRDPHNDRLFRDLSVIGTNLTTGQPVVYSTETTPDMKISAAVRISMSIPLFFAAIKAENGDILVDGGISWNYPIDLFDRQSSGQRIWNPATLGLRCDTPEEIDAQKQDWRGPPRQITSLFSFSKALVGFMQEMANDAHLRPADWHRTIFIPAAGVTATDFDLPQIKVAELLENGRCAVRKYFDWFDDPKADPRPLNRIVA